MTCHSDSSKDLIQDQRFHKAVQYFNNKEWYLAHDLLEELWHDSIGPERTSLEVLLQIAVAQLHLDRGNKNGAMILYGEGLGRLRRIGIPNLGIDMNRLCNSVEHRLRLLQSQKELSDTKFPELHASKSLI